MNIEEIIGKKNIGIVESKEFTFGEVNHLTNILSSSKYLDI